MAAPQGNQFAAKAKEWEQALKRVMARKAADRGEAVDFRHTLDRIANEVVNQALDGNMNAWREIADRMDGKPAQVVGGDPEGEPIKHVFTWKNAS